MGVLIKILAIPVAVLGAFLGAISGLFASIFGLSKAAITAKKLEKGAIPCPICASKPDVNGLFSKDPNCSFCEGYGMIEKCILCNQPDYLQLQKDGRCIGCNGWGFQVGTSFLGFQIKKEPPSS
jgi:hypothetical protein